MSRKLKWTLGITASLIILLLIFHSFIFTALGRFLVVREELKPADCIVVLAGERGERVSEGIKLYRQKVAPMLLMSGGPSEGNIPLSVIMKAQAENDGIPPSDILMEDKSLDTGEDALYVRDIVKGLGYKRLVLVTSPYHSRRANYIFSKVFKGSGIEIISYPVEDSWFNCEGWWKRKKDTKVVLMEYAKFMWYLIRGIEKPE